MKRFLSGVPFLLSVLFSALLVGCSNESASENDPNLPDTDNDSAVVLTEETTRYFMEVTETGITISDAIPETSLPKAGEIICCGITEQTPDGYLGRVVDIERISGGYIVRTEQVALDEAFKTLSADAAFDVGTAIESITDEEGVEYTCTPVDASIWGEVSTEGNSTGTRGETSGTATVAIPLDGISADGISLSGALYLSARLDVKLDIDRHTLNLAHIELSTRVGSSVTFAAEYSGEYEKELKTFNIGLGRIPIAGGLIILRPMLKLSLVAGISGEISARMTLHNEYAARSCYIHYENGIWTQGYEDRTPASEGQSIAASLEMSGELFTEARLGMLVGVYSGKIIGIGFDAAGKQALTGSFTLSNEDLYLQNPDIAVNRTLSANFYFYARLFGRNLGRHEVSTPDLSLGQTVLRLFPEMEMRTISSAHGTVSVEGVWNPGNTLLAVEYGVALFDRDGSVEARKRSGDSDALNQTQQVSLSFATDTRVPHFVAPYVRTQNDRYYYGKKVPAEETSIVGTWHGISCTEDCSECIEEYNYWLSIDFKSNPWVWTFREDGTGEFVWCILKDGSDPTPITYFTNSAGDVLTVSLFYSINPVYQYFTITELTGTHLTVVFKAGSGCLEHKVTVRFERIE